LADLEPVELRQHDVEHDEVDRLVAEARECLFAVGGLHDVVAVAFEREGEHLAHRFLVVDEEDCRVLGHRSCLPCTSSDGSASYYSPEMAAPPPTVRRRRRPRRGSLERPVSSQLYRSAFLACSLPLLIAAFTVTRPAALQKPLLPPAFDTRATLELAKELATEYPDRAPGSSGALAAAQWFREHLAPYGFATNVDTWTATLPGGGQARLKNVTAVAPAQAPGSDAIVVMAHRDDTGAGPGANDDATGTAALIEL